MAENEKNEHEDSGVRQWEAGSEIYMNVSGCYTAWNMDVNLDPPFIPCNNSLNSIQSGSQEMLKKALCNGSPNKWGSAPKMDPTEEKLVKSYYNDLQHILYETNHPETKDKTKDGIGKMSCGVKRPYENRVTIVAFSTAVDCMGHLLEGGRQCPGEMLLVLSKTWLSKRPSDVSDSSHKLSESTQSLSDSAYSLFVHKAISFKSGGRTHLKHFDPPRRATYLLNQLTSVCTDNLCCDGDELEKDLDCPMNITIKIGNLLDDKLWTRIKMAEVGVAFPETLAFSYMPRWVYRTDDLRTINVIVIEKEGCENMMLKCIRKFVCQPYMVKHNKIVVKPSGPMWSSAIGVTYHQRSDPMDIWKAAMNLLQHIQEGDTILVEAYYETMSRPGSNDRREMKNMISWRATNETAARVRATVVRNADDTSKCSQLVCGIWYQDCPVNGNNTSVMTLDSLLIMYSVTDPFERARVDHLIRRGSEQILSTLTHHVSSMTLQQKGAALAHCDVIGIDYILAMINGEITPVAVEVNGPNSTTNCDRQEFVHTSMSGDSFRDVVHAMIYRSQKYILKGKRFLVVGIDASVLEMLMKAAIEYDIQMLLVHPDLSYKPLLDESMDFLAYDFSDHSQDILHASNIIQCLTDRKFKLNGCLTFNTNCAFLVALINNQLSLNGPGVESTLQTLNVKETQSRLITGTREIYHLPHTNIYALGNIRAVQPTVLDAMVDLHQSEMTAMNQRNTVLRKSVTKEDNLLNDRKSQLLVATRHQIVLVQHKRKKVAAFICDLARSSSQEDSDLILTMPSCSPLDFQDQLICSAYQCSVEMGLVSGVFVVEMWMTYTGPKFIRIFPFLNSVFIHQWIRDLYGLDIFLAMSLIACNIRPQTFECVKKPSACIVGVLTGKRAANSHCLGGLKRTDRGGTSQKLGMTRGAVSASFSSATLVSGSIGDHRSMSDDKFSLFVDNKLKSSPLDSDGYASPDCESVSEHSDSRLDHENSSQSEIGEFEKGYKNMFISSLKSENSELLKVLTDNGVVRVIWHAGDVCAGRPGYLVYLMDHNHDSAKDKLSGVLSLVGMSYLAKPISDLVNTFKDFEMGLNISHCNA